MATNKFKLTNQRVTILDYLKENYTHPTVDVIFNYVKNKLPRISKKTVYSNLQFLCDKGLIQELKLNGLQRYEPKLELHHHLICKKCGKIIDIQSDKLCKQTMEVGKRIQDFDVEFFNINFFGICKECQGGK